MSRKVLGAVLLLAALAKPAQAAVWDHYGTTSYYYPSYSYYSYPVYSYYPTYYYTPAPAVRYYLPAEAVVQPATICTTPTIASVPVSNGGPTFAQPSAAPPSQNKEPPLDKKGLAPPKVTESRSFTVGDDKGLAAVDAKGECRVGFWNITGRDVTLTVNGKAVVVRSDRSVTLTLRREFSWQVEGQAAHEERVPEDKAAHEIVLR